MALGSDKALGVVPRVIYFPVLTQLSGHSSGPHQAGHELSLFGVVLSGCHGGMVGKGGTGQKGPKSCIVNYVVFQEFSLGAGEIISV